MPYQFPEFTGILWNRLDSCSEQAVMQGRAANRRPGSQVAGEQERGCSLDSECSQDVFNRYYQINMKHVTLDFWTIGIGRRDADNGRS